MIEQPHSLGDRLYARPELPALARVAWEETWGEDVVATCAIHLARRDRYHHDPKGVSGWQEYLPDEDGQVRYMNFVKDAVLRGLRPVVGGEPSSNGHLK